ncbi:hypothetical protein [Hyphomicrobium sp.]|uniref:hypothetical protein n=1 Tax=Hyphomicrobium sp. TaxID=82 RepID=UPI000FC267C7|nr:hypothetical protein [Hyphomicrobium sp.]RUO97674.1 MAG: hypothetical protein EKK30_12980 [Hyphomicrobium sp.]
MAGPMQGFFKAPDFPFHESFIRETVASMGLPFDLSTLCFREQDIEFGLMIRALEELDRQGVDFREALGRVEDPAVIWQQPVSVMFASGKFAATWWSATLSLGALAFVTTTRCWNAAKDQRALVLSKVKGKCRKKADVLEVHGLSLDDDGVIGRDRVQPKYLLISFGTASDGKDRDLIECEAYADFAKKKKRSHPPTNASVAEYLNQNCPHGDAYRAVTLECLPKMPDKLQVICSEDGRLHYSVAFEPQQRTRYLVVFSRPLGGDLLKALLALPKGFLEFCRRIELKTLGCHGTDEACFEPVRVGYLPSGNKGEFYHAILGGPELIDPVPIAEKVIAETPPREVKTLTVTPMVGDVPLSLRRTLKGVRLASLIADNYPDLVHKENGLEPLILRCCPFCDEHSLKRGEADNTLFCYDPSDTAYPTMRCHHNSCKGRKTEAFVGELIARGELHWNAVYENSDYRDLYAEEEAAKPKVIARNYKILW